MHKYLKFFKSSSYLISKVNVEIGVNFVFFEGSSLNPTT